ncbi:MAG: sulfite reductase [Rhodospirillales bacterium]|jgi:sulfite reductase (NADPH) hemoprotein beta-component|nr:sulfite reductase [Rhodospirillales bacterium]
MYQYDEIDQTLTRERVNEYRDQVSRRFKGDLTEDQFRPLRLRNGLYMQLHAYMLRVAIPYGLLSSKQMRKLAYIARTYDKNYGHFTTRQNIQYNWPKLEDTPDILAHLAEVEMNAIQTSGNNNRNVTSDPYAGVAKDEIEDPRPYAEIVRQFVTLHPEFSWLPRKFKIALTGADHDRAAINVHDIGLKIVRNDKGEIGFRVLVGGGLGRTPFIAKIVREFLPKRELLRYLQAILRVYNMEGRRDNMFKARIKILVHEHGIERFRNDVEAEFAASANEPLDLDAAEEARMRAYFAPPAYEKLPADDAALTKKLDESADFRDWYDRNIVAHKQPGYAIVNISLKPLGQPPGDCTDEQMDAVADLADKYSLGQLRVTHRQNLVFADVKKSDLFALYQDFVRLKLATPNFGRITDIIACPGLDFCSLANARSIPVAQRIAERFADLKRQNDIGDMHINISGCINACGHHHVAHLGILGVEKNGEEYYQVTLGGSSAEDADIGKIIGPAFSSEDIVDAVESLVDVYLTERHTGERFLDTYRRVGQAPFKDRLYGSH